MKSVFLEGCSICRYCKEKTDCVLGCAGKSMRKCRLSRWNEWLDLTVKIKEASI